MDHTYNTIPHRLKMTEPKTSWTHNPEFGIVIGVLITRPKQMEFLMEINSKFVVTAFVIDSSKRKWRVRANSNVAGQLLNLSIGQKIRLIGVKGDLCKGAWDNAKRQIVPESLSLKSKNKPP